MNPLSTWTYYRRHKRHVSLLLSLSIIITVGLYTLVALVWGVFVEPGRLAYMALSKFSMVTPLSVEDGLVQSILTRIEANNDVAKVFPAKTIKIQLPSVIPDNTFQFDLLGLLEEDVPYILERLGTTLADGRLPKPGKNELVLSEDVANMLDVNVGDSYDVISSEFYPNVDVTMASTLFEVVGVLKSDIEVGIVPLEFLNNHPLYRQFPARFLVVAQENAETAVDDFLRSDIQSIQTSVLTLEMLNERIMNEALPGLVMLLPVILVVSLAFSLVINVANQLANARRLPEFGILHTTGLSRGWLIRRLTIETAIPAVAGWAVGLGLSWSSLYLLKITYFASRGHDLNFVAWMPVLFTLPIPLTIAGFTFLSVRRTLSQLDPVAIVERGELSQEKDQKRKKGVTKSSPKPLAPATFYRRHRRRAILLISGTSVMIMAIIFFIFALAVSADAQKPFLGYLSRISIVRSPGLGQSLDPDVVTRIQGHPAIERIIPVAPRNHMLDIYIPPFTTIEASPYGVYEEDMVYLVELYGLKLKEGQLPRPGTSEMVIPESLAQNRDLTVGDVIGDPNQPPYPGASSLPVEFVISGIFARPNDPEGGEGLGFVSLDFLEKVKPFSIPDVTPVIVVAVEGQADALSDWLENEFTVDEASVLTYRRELARTREQSRQNMLAMAIVQGVIAVVAAIGLAVLNIIFNAQRHSEFGVLHALGISRVRLVGRVMGETTFTTGVAWVFSTLIAMMVMLGLRFAIFTPRGLTFNLLNITPWLYTLPIPLAVLFATTVTTAWMLSKVDPVSIIERRSHG